MLVVAGEKDRLDMAEQVTRQEQKRQSQQTAAAIETGGSHPGPFVKETGRNPQVTSFTALGEKLLRTI